MQLTILGSGTSVPLPDRASPSLAVEVENETILMDMGPGTLRQMARAGLRHESVGRIF